jgi:hypothetical protein
LQTCTNVCLRVHARCKGLVVHFEDKKILRDIHLNETTTCGLVFPTVG